MTLEAERHNTDYLKFTARAQAEAKALQAKMREERLRVEARAQARSMIAERLPELSKAYFNAGRFAAGATDHTARKAHEAMLKLEKA